MKNIFLAVSFSLFIILSSCDKLVNPTLNINCSRGIVFESYQNGESDIYIMNLDGSDIINLTDNLSGEYFNPDAAVNSPNIVFESHWSPNPNSSLPRDNSTICSTNRNDKKINYISNSEHDYSPRLSPDGQAIVFVTITNRSGDIYMMDFKGSIKLRLTFSGGNGGSTFSHDGSKILFGSIKDDSCDIFVMSTDGSNKMRLTYSGTNISPKFSPDDSKIVYESYDENLQIRDIYSMNVDGSDVKNLTDNQKKNFYPVYSPDGSKIVFVTKREEFFEIFIMDADGNNCTKLTNNSRHYYPKFSPDGLYIFYCSYESDTQMYIYRMDIDGSNKMKLHAGRNFNIF